MERYNGWIDAAWLQYNGMYDDDNYDEDYFEPDDEPYIEEDEQ